MPAALILVTTAEHASKKLMVDISVSALKVFMAQSVSWLQIYVLTLMEQTTAMAMAFVKSSMIHSQTHYVHIVPALENMSQQSGVDFSWGMIPVRLKLIPCHVVMEYATMSWVADILVNVLEVSELQ